LRRAIGDIVQPARDLFQMPAAHRAVEPARAEQRTEKQESDATQQAKRLPAHAHATKEKREAARRTVIELLRRRPGSHRLREASSTIHCTNSPNERPSWAAISGTSDVSVMPGWVLTSRQMRSPEPSGRLSKRKSALLIPRHPS